MDANVSSLGFDSPEQNYLNVQIYGAELFTLQNSPKYRPLPVMLEAEKSHAWHLDVAQRHVKNVVADKDYAPGDLVIVERPFLTVPIAKFAGVVCHGCLNPLNKAGNGNPAAGNPCLPRYCQECKKLDHDIDSKLAALRIKLPGIATEHSLDPTMLHIVMLLDLQRCGFKVGMIPEGLLASGNSDAENESRVQSTVVDFDVLTNVWDRKTEAWRKKVGPAIRALHKELQALADSGSLPGYKASSLTRMQTDAAQISIHVQTIAAPKAGTTDTGVGMFPCLSQFQHCCAPNAFFLTVGSELFIRAIVPIPKGTEILVSFANIADTRSNRQTLLESERHIVCHCARCQHPLDHSIDRLIEGVVCLDCRMDVLLPLDPGSENDKAAEVYKQRLKEDREYHARVVARRARKGKVKKESKQEEEDDGEITVPEGVVFWRCCSCGSVEPAHTVKQDGPGDVIAQANRLLQQGTALMSIKHPELSTQGEAMLEELAGTLEGRLPPYHVKVLEALPPLINVNMKKGQAVKVLNYAIQLWDTERQLVEERPTMQQLQCLEAIIDAAEHKASSASSVVIKRQFSKRVKQAEEQLKETRKILLGK